jgi:hypothetical protein
LRRKNRDELVGFAVDMVVLVIVAALAFAVIVIVVRMRT